MKKLSLFYYALRRERLLHCEESNASRLRQQQKCLDEHKPEANSGSTLYPSCAVGRC